MTIEIIGPPGIGKSTLYEAVCKSWNPKCRWTYQEKLLNSGHFKNASFKWVIYQLYRRLTGKSANNRLSIDQGMRFIQQHSELAEFIWKHISDPAMFPETKQAERYRAFYLLFSDFMRYQAIVEAAKQRPCIIQEGFFQKSFLLQVPESDLTPWVEQYLQLAPKPELVFSMEAADPLPIAVRLENRGKCLPAHEGLDRNGLIGETKRWQQIFTVIQQQMQKQHIRFELLDGLKPVTENTGIINHCLNAL